MDKIRRFIGQKDGLNILIIVFVTLVFSILFAKHCGAVLTDRGREFLLPQEVLNGKIPYKDISLIYFPFALYINALIYKIFGVSINALIVSQTFVCTIFMSLYYYLSKEFLNCKISVLLAIFIISCCILTPQDLFSYILPYSYARIYGIFATWGCVFSLIKLLKTHNIKFAYVAAVFAGFAICCKLEFLPILLLLIVGLILYKKFDIKTYIKLFLCFIIFPIFVLGILFAQGVTVNELFEAFVYGAKFAKTPVMVEFLSNSGMYPLNIFQNFYDFATTKLPNIIVIILLCLLGILAKNKYKTFLFIPFTFLVIFLFYYDGYYLQQYWAFLPITIGIIFCLNFKKFLHDDKSLFFILLSAIVLSQREFFSLYLYSYGTYSLPLLLLCMCVLIDRCLPEKFFEIKTKNILVFISVTLILLNSYNLLSHRQKYNYPLKMSKGVLYTDPATGKLLERTINYIENYIKKDATILVLPEGNIINYATDRKVDLRCFMMDRLYHDAFGEEKAKEMVEQTNSDYIILMRGMDVNNFNRPYIYESNTNKVSSYIAKNYKAIKTFNGDNQDKVVIMKKELP